MSDEKPVEKPKWRKRGRREQVARARPASREQLIERHREIREIMLELRWVKGVTGPELAAKWGVAVATVEGYAAEESRRIVGDRDEARRDITAGCRVLMAQAVQDKNAKDFTAVGGLLAMVSGAKTPEEHIVTSTTMEATPAEAARMVREAFGEKAMAKPNGLNGHAKPNGAGTVPPDASKA